MRELTFYNHLINTLCEMKPKHLPQVLYEANGGKGTLRKFDEIDKTPEEKVPHHIHYLFCTYMWCSYIFGARIFEALVYLRRLPPP